MTTTRPAIQNLARRLIALETTDGSSGAALRTCDKLRTPLSKLAGVAGFRSLMARAKALATAEVPWLDSVQVRADGSLGDFDASSSQHSAEEAAKASVALVAQLLGLLVTFIGEPLMLHFVRDAWPLVTGSDAGIGEKS